MKAWRTVEPGVLAESDVPVPTPGEREVLVKVEACGVCRTDLHVIDREIPEHRNGVIPGHQVVGTVVARGSAVAQLQVGDRVGIPWLRSTCSVCVWCRQGKENLCPNSRYTGWDADGGYAEFATVPEAFAYRLDPSVDPVVLAPLLCAGIIGYRALQRANLPPGGNLGIYGFGSSAHLAAQVAMRAGAKVFALTRGEESKRLARNLGVEFVGDAVEPPPEPLDSAIVFAPAGAIVPFALRATTRGGTVALAGIHMTDVPSLNYTQDLFFERDLRTVTSNTRADGLAFLRLARNLEICPAVRTYPATATGEAVNDLRNGRTSGSLVIVH